MGGGGQASSRHGQQQSMVDKSDKNERPTAARAMLNRGPSGELGFIR
jgi:hypothetical protein